MSEDQDRDDADQLFDSDISEGDSATASTTDDSDEQFEETSSDEQSSEEHEEALKLEVPVKKSTSSKQKEKQILSWMNKIEMGDRTLDDIPKNLKWLKAEVEDRLNPQEEEPDIQSTIQTELQKVRDAEKFQELKDLLNSQSLDGEQKTKVEAKFKKFLKYMPKSEALQEAIDASGITFAYDRGKHMFPPKPSKAEEYKSNRLNEDNWREKLNRNDPRRIRILDNQAKGLPWNSGL